MVSERILEFLVNNPVFLGTYINKSVYTPDNRTLKTDERFKNIHESFLDVLLKIKVTEEDVLKTLEFLSKEEIERGNKWFEDNQSHIQRHSYIY